MAATFLAARRQDRHDLVDVAWGAGFALVAAVSALLSTGHGDPLRTWVVAGLTAVWGLRLAVHIGARRRGAGEDPRYTELLSGAPGRRDIYALRTVYLPQGLLVWAVSLPVQAAAYTPGPASALLAVGAGVWLTGFLFEAVGDAQLARFKADPDNRGRIMDRGLWAWTRHPNYFGDACVWWGLYIAGADTWPGLLTLPAPAVMTLLLTAGSGKRLLEARMRDRPGWSEYARRTSGFLPLPPRRPLA
ncbi:DUF1295 domain-containing protein [Streptomonospora wellingtoniae]|uniref:DUF1295 domain-containing protein n=1 Tax=Streptomonospora wellingtoniae TaxID=3075544 RepID=A0ABU2KP03_9ACTN|nr:DUF1295 domain-containing protein [Streptomonospora sp. DSM 45055]MDT0300922.1 DUF1295 domain-containing protein [Streptomonospora sp. DSM 45055]